MSRDNIYCCEAGKKSAYMLVFSSSKLDSAWIIIILVLSSSHKNSSSTMMKAGGLTLNLNCNFNSTYPKMALKKKLLQQVFLHFQVFQMQEFSIFTKKHKWSSSIYFMVKFFPLRLIKSRQDNSVWTLWAFIFCWNSPPRVN